MTHQIQQPASPDNGNPHASWLKEWRRQTAIWEQADDDSPDGQAAWAQREALARKLASVPASGIEGLAAQLAFISEDLGDYIAGMVGSPINTAMQVAAEGASQIAASAAQHEDGSAD